MPSQASAASLVRRSSVSRVDCMPPTALTHIRSNAPDAVFAASHCDASTRLVLRGDDVAATGTDVVAWPPICDCGANSAATAYGTVAAAQRVAAGADGPGGAGYVDFRGTGAAEDTSLSFFARRNPFYFAVGDGGVIATAVVRLRLSALQDVGYIFDVRCAGVVRCVARPGTHFVTISCAACSLALWECGGTVCEQECWQMSGHLRYDVAAPSCSHAWCHPRVWSPCSFHCRHVQPWANTGADGATYHDVEATSWVVVSSVHKCVCAMAGLLVCSHSSHLVPCGAVW